MPSIAMADSPKDSSSKKLKKSAALLASAEQNGASKEESKKAKKEKKDKKRKLSEDDEKSDTSADLGDVVAVAEAKSSKKKKKVKVSDDEGEVVEGAEEVADPNAVSRFRIAPVLREKLKSKGIESLFPIQSMTFDIILDGADLVGRARTGQGKTLAFVLPILESLTNGQNKESRKTGYGRPPSVLVLLPTRELANQVFGDFQLYGGAVGLTACCLYGGSPFSPQESALRRGVDVVVGTPGRIKDHIERSNLDLKSLKFRVLDEADEMLNMGFVDDVEYILKKVEDSNKVQTLLFSATLPDWVKKISSRFLKPAKKIADLVGNEKLKASASVRHLVLPCARNARQQLIPDVIRCYSNGGRTIIFTETKDSVSQLAGLIPGARAFSGDVMQAQREVILAGFRSGKFLVLVATNVAARGLDINDVQLIIQCEPPRDVEAYIHRSGRTGRAGNTGVAVLLYEPRQSFAISKIERESGVKFERVSAPQPADVAMSAGSTAADAILSVSDSVVPVFRSQAEHLLSSSGLPPVDLLAKALAKAAGYTEIKNRSLLSSMENYVTLILQEGRKMYSPSYAYGILKRFMPDEKVEGIKGLALTEDGMSAVFDVPSGDVDLFLEGQNNASSVSIEVLKELPPLQEREQQSRYGSGGVRGRFGGGNRRGGGGSFGRRGGGGGGRGGNRFGRRN